MTKTSRFWKSLLYICPLLFSFALLAKDKIPPTIREQITQSIRARFPDAHINRIKRAQEKGIDVYRVSFAVRGKKVDGDVTLDGVLLETEEPVESITFSEPAIQALKKASARLDNQGIRD